MNENQIDEIKKMAKRFDVPEEIVEAGLIVRHASTMLEKWEAFQKERNLIERGDPEAVRRQHEWGKLTARERIAKLLDQDSFEELELWSRPYETGFDIGEERGQGDGVSVGYGTIKGRTVNLWAQDATVLGGTMAAIHARKITMIAEKAIQGQTPIVGLFDSEGVRVQDAIQFPDFFSSCSIARFQTIASGVIPRISLVMGPCVGEQAMLAGLSDFLFMVKNTSYLHLTPSFPSPDSQKIGDPEVQAKVTGVCDVLAENDEDCLQKCLQLLSFLPSNNAEGPPYVNTGDDPDRRSEELLELVPVKSSKPYRMHKLISLIVDNGEFFEIKRHWAKNLITGFSRFDGSTVGIIANNPQDKAGCMTLDAADKMSRFVRFCDAFNIPLLWLADTPGFLPAIDEETRGLIRHGSRMIQANSEASVPQICLAIRKIYGGGRLAMPGPSLGGDLNIAWPTHEPGLMGAEGGVAIIYRRELGAIQDENLRMKQKAQRVMELQWGLDMMVREATQGIIDPRDTRPFIIRAFRWLRNKKQDWPARKHENFQM